MRVLITNGVRWWNASAHYAVDLARALARRGHDVLLAVRAGTPAEAWAARAGVELDLSFDFRSRRLPRDVGRMARLLRRRSFDVVNPHRAGDQNVLLLARRLAGAGVPLYRTRVDVKEFRPNAMNRVLYRHGLQGIVTPGEGSRSLLLEHYRVPEPRVEAVLGGVETAQFTPARRSCELRRSLGIPDGRLAVGLVARLGRIKGHAHFFEAAARIAALANGSRPPGDPVWLVIGKETEYKIAELSILAAGHGLKEVRFTGHREDIADVMACLDVGVVASTGSEAHCRVGLELLASGVPIVGTRVGVIPEIVRDGVDGFLVPAADGAALADRLLRLLASDQTRAGFAREARRVAEERYSFDAWAARTEAAFERLRRS